MLAKKSIHILSYASAVGAASQGGAQGPLLLQQSAFFADLNKQGLELHCDATIQPEQQNSSSKLKTVAKLCNELAEQTTRFAQKNQLFAVFGGDHTCAIGTWSGVAFAKRKIGPIGLIWVDAHMDSHTPETTLSGNLHGMPVATLLGQGDNSLTKILDELPKIKPENICLIGVRSFEDGEAALLKQLNVKIFFMDEVKKRGLAAVFADAVKIVSQRTCGYGLSIDVDSLDPQDAPGTGVAEPDGILAQDLCHVLKRFANDPQLIGFEIVEFDPSRDIEQRTEKLIPQLVSAITLGK